MAGAVIQLRSNSPHLADFFQENFFPAALDGEIAPHAVIYAVKDVPGRGPTSVLSLPTSTGFVFNTAFYGQLRSQVLALAAESAARAADSLFAHCAVLDREGRGVLVWGGPGSGRTGVLAAALQEDGVKLVASDAVLVRLNGSTSRADLPERKLYLKAKWAKHLPQLEALLDRAKLENIVTRRDQCTVEYCAKSDDCPLDRGGSACMLASTAGRIMVDPAWLAGGGRHARRTTPRLSVLLAKEPALPAAQEVNPREAARYLAGGLLPGSRGRAIPFLNPHLPGSDTGRLDALRAQHERLFANTRCILLNTAIGAADAIARRMLDALR